MNELFELLENEIVNNKVPPVPNDWKKIRNKVKDAIAAASDKVLEFEPEAVTVPEPTRAPRVEEVTTKTEVYNDGEEDYNVDVDTVVFNDGEEDYEVEI